MVLVSALCIAGCDGGATTPGSTDPSTPTAAATEPCALTHEEVEGILGEPVTETFSDGNWGIASNCTYATASAGVAVDLASAASTDLSSDRAIEGSTDVDDLGDDAVWNAVTSRLAVADEASGSLLRIGVGVGEPGEGRLTVARAVAELALTRL